MQRASLTAIRPLSQNVRLYSTEKPAETKAPFDFKSKFDEMRKEFASRIRGENSARMMDPELYRVTPKYRETSIDEYSAPLNKQEGFNYADRVERIKLEYHFGLKNLIVPNEGTPADYYKQVYKQLEDHLTKVYPDHFVVPSDGYNRPVLPHPHSEYYKTNDESVRTWRNAFVKYTDE